jgi:crotonobetainyl-CoA:carnitine CoA-transferase CaiB-like acyl-CoA transferase
MPGALNGVKVIELGIWVAAPAAAAILADWGAEVIKIEEPESGDPLRGLGATGLVPIDLAANPAFTLDNRGKKGMALNLHRRGAIKVLKDLVAQADVFLSNLRTAALQRLGLTYAQLQEVNPRLIYAGCTGYGVEGPDRDRAAFDYAAFWARAGVMAALGEPGQPPPTQRPGMGDHTTALAIAGAIAAALFAREKTGRGQEIRLSLLRTGIWFQGTDVQVCLETRQDTPPRGRRNAPNPLFTAYQTKDGRWLHLVMLQPDRHWPDFCRAIGHEEFILDHRFITVRERMENAATLVAMLDSLMASKTLDEWGAIFDRHGVFWGKVQSVGEVVRDVQARASGAFRKVKLGSGEEIEVVASPADFTDTPAEVRGPAPELGQHTEEILLSLGYSWEEIAALKDTGTIG